MISFISYIPSSLSIWFWVFFFFRCVFLTEREKTRNSFVFFTLHFSHSCIMIWYILDLVSFRAMDDFMHLTRTTHIHLNLAHDDVFRAYVYHRNDETKLIRCVGHMSENLYHHIRILRAKFSSDVKEVCIRTLIYVLCLI